MVWHGRYCELALRVCRRLCYIADQPIIEVPKEVIIEEGKEKKIMINISGLPRPQNSTCWNDSSAEEVDSGRFKCELEHLMIGPLFESDEGQYTVEARNCFGLQTAQMNITVHSEIHLRNAIAVDDGMLCFLFQDLQALCPSLQTI